MTEEKKQNQDAIYKPWLQSYPQEVPFEVDTCIFNSLLDLYEFSCEKYSDKVAYISMDTRITYAELDVKVRCFAAFLQNELKLKRGDRIALMLPNIIQYPIALFGALMAGCVIVNCNPMYTARELKHQLSDSGAKVVVVVSNFASVLQAAIADLETVEHVVVTSFGDEIGTLKGTVINLALKYLKRLVPHFRFENCTSWHKALAIGHSYPYSRVLVNREDLAFLQYTGGTTGVAKGAMLTHHNLLANIAQALGMYGQCLQEGNEFVVTAIPLYHVFAMTINCLLFLHIGGTSLLIADPRRIKAMLKEVGKYEPSCITGVNTLFGAMVNHEYFTRLNLSKLRLCVGGGTAVKQGVATRWFSATGIHILEGYGLTECSPLVAVNPYNIDEYNGTIGIPVPSTEIKIIDENGKVITETNKPGELLVKGPQVMSGYYGREVATQKVFDGAFLKTGDMACWANERGFIKLVDRKKDMIIVSGFNVYPNEIEDVISMHPLVMEVCAIGVPSKHSGECVKVFVVRRNRTLSEDKVVELCRKRLAAYKVPKQVEFIEANKMPKSNVGKVLRRELRERELRKRKLLGEVVPNEENAEAKGESIASQSNK